MKAIALAVMMVLTGLTHLTPVSGNDFGMTGYPQSSTPSSTSADGEVIRLKPYEVYIGSRLVYGTEGKVQYERHLLQVVIRLEEYRPNPAAKVSHVELTQAITDSGERLPLRALDRGDAQGEWGAMPNLKIGYGFNGEPLISLELDSGGKPIQEMREMSGMIYLRKPEAEHHVVRLHPISRFLGQRLTFKQIPGQYLTISRDHDGNFSKGYLHFEMSAGLAGYLADVAVTDSQMTPYEDLRWTHKLADGGPRQKPGTLLRFLEKDLPGDAMIHLKIYAAEDVRRVPFVVRPFMMTQAVTHLKPDMTLPLNSRSE